MKSGEPPTARKARTGELTPPGRSSLASAKSRSEVSCFMPGGKPSRRTRTFEPAPGPLADEARQRLDEHGIVVQGRGPLESDTEPIGDRTGAEIDVEEDLHVVGDEPDRHADDIADATGRELLEMVAEVGPRPGLRRTAGRLIAERPPPVGKAGPLGDKPRRLMALGVVGVSRGEHPLREAVSAEDDVHALALVLRPAGEPLGHPRRERVDEPRRVVIAGNVLELDSAAIEVEPVCDLLLVARHGHGAEVRREHEADRMRDAVLDHLADDLLDPRRPVAHPEIAPVSVPETLRERVDLPARHFEKRRASADRAVALRDLPEQLVGRRTPGADVGEVARDLGERGRAAVGHDQNPHRQADGHDEVRSRTCSTRRRTLSTGVCGTRPWPTLKMWPGRPPARSRTSSIRNLSTRQGASSVAGSRLPCTGRSKPTRSQASSSGRCQSIPITSPPQAAASARYELTPSE